MAKRTSTLQHSKVTERKVARYLFGPDAVRDWKEDHDLSGTDLNDHRWVGEVKDYSHETIKANGGVLQVALTALEQAEATPAGSRCPRCFGWVHTKRRNIDTDCVAYRWVDDQVVYQDAETFRKRFVRWEGKG